MTAPPDFLAADFEAYLEGECRKYACDFKVVGALGRNAGEVRYGDDIGLGEHTLSGSTAVPNGTTYFSETTFTIEGPDSAVCNAPR